MKRLYKTIALMMTIAVLAALCLTGCSAGKPAGSGELTKVTFCLEWTPNTNHTGLYVARKLGYFKDAGLDVDIVMAGDSTAALMVASGQAAFGIDGQDTMAAALIGEDALDIVAVATIIQHNTSCLMSLKSDGITSPAKLEGKKYATWNSPIEIAVIKYLMEKDGGDFSKLQLIPNEFYDEPAALKSDVCDSIWIFYAWGGVYAEMQEADMDYLFLKDYASELDYYTPVIISSNKYLGSNPETAKAFMAAVKKGYEYAIDHPDEAADILLAAVPDVGDKDFIHASQKELSANYKGSEASWGKIDPARWNSFYNWLNNNVSMEEKLPENIGFTNDYLN